MTGKGRAMTVVMLSTLSAAIFSAPRAEAGFHQARVTPTASMPSTGIHYLLPITPLRSTVQPSASGGGQLTYHDGPVQKTPSIYLVFWDWGTGGDPDGESPYLQSFLSGVGGSGWLNTVTQYGEIARGTVANPVGQLQGVWWDNTDPIPFIPSAWELANEAALAAEHFPTAGPDAEFVIATPHAHNVIGFPSQYCGYHSNTTYAAEIANPVEPFIIPPGISYVNLPYIPDALATCGAGSVNSPGTLDGVSVVAGHEVAETQTDPLLNAWYDAAGQEIGDKCAWSGLRNYTFASGTFSVQPLWSNQSSGCVLSFP